MHVWLNGGIVDPDDAWVGVDDHGLVVGNGGFETLVVVRGRAFALRRHLERLGCTLDALGIAAPPAAILRAAVAEVIDASGLDSGRLRLTVTGGRGSLGTRPPAGPPTIVAVVTPMGPPANRAAIVVPWTRNEHGATAGLKTTSYAENVRALDAARRDGADEALFANTAGELCEGTGSNVFVVHGERVATPPLSSGCLPGVTRDLVLQLSGATEGALPLDALRTADEVFLTSTTRGVQGLTCVDDRELRVGPVTERVAAAFADLVARDLDP